MAWTPDARAAALKTVAQVDASTDDLLARSRKDRKRYVPDLSTFNKACIAKLGATAGADALKALSEVVSQMLVTIRRATKEQVVAEFTPFLDNIQRRDEILEEEHAHEVQLLNCKLADAERRVAALEADMAQRQRIDDCATPARSPTTHAGGAHEPMPEYSSGQQHEATGQPSVPQQCFAPDSGAEGRCAEVANAKPSKRRRRRKNKRGAALPAATAEARSAEEEEGAGGESDLQEDVVQGGLEQMLEPQQNQEHELEQEQQQEEEQQLLQQAELDHEQEQEPQQERMQQAADASMPDAAAGLSHSPRDGAAREGAPDTVERARLPTSWADDDELGLDVPPPAPRHPARDAAMGPRQVAACGSQQAAATAHSFASYPSRPEFWTCPHCALTHFAPSDVCGNPACRRARSPSEELLRGMTSLDGDSALSDGVLGVQSTGSTGQQWAGCSSSYSTADIVSTDIDCFGTGCWGAAPVGSAGLDGHGAPYAQSTAFYGLPQQSCFLPQLLAQPDLPQPQSMPLEGQLPRRVYAQPVYPDLYEMGMKLHPRVAAIYPAQADKLTGMLLDRGPEFAAAVLSDLDLLVQAVEGARLTLERAEGALPCASAPAPAPAPSQRAAPQAEPRRRLYLPPSARRQRGC
eukprot:TRINITY_DN17035_c0_g1_i1.p1 TRINITY_DN17035_c0_g1~~TRINITY_DN17035_c0_g1_i1.p1  ORF type:complete len:636 (+),score=165.60 TRINITY_DN17035_c0_g1_i1:75-1982(+)